MHRVVQVGPLVARGFAHETGDLHVRDGTRALRIRRLDDRPPALGDFGRVGRRARVGQHQRTHAAPVPAPERKRDVAADRQTDDHRALDLQRVEHGRDVVGVPVHAERPHRRRFAEPAKVDRNAAALGHERADLRIPHGAVERKRVEEDDRKPRSDVVVGDGGIADEGDHSFSGHWGSMPRQLSGTGTGCPS